VFNVSRQTKYLGTSNVVVFKLSTSGTAELDGNCWGELASSSHVGKSSV